jgi:hypothetical protein
MGLFIIVRKHPLQVRTHAPNRSLKARTRLHRKIEPLTIATEEGGFMPRKRWLFVATLDQDLIPIAKHKREKPITFRLENPISTVW